MGGVVMTIQLDINDSKVDLFLSILNSFKSGIVEKFVVVDSKNSKFLKTFDDSHIEEVSDEENEYCVKLLESLTDEDKEISSIEHGCFILKGYTTF